MIISFIILVNASIINCICTGDHVSWLIGDSGYPQEPWLMIPINNAPLNTPDERYTLALVSTRSCIERCNGVYKARFRCVLGERTLHYTPRAAARSAQACAVLHNICIEARLADGINPIEWDDHDNNEPDELPNDQIRGHVGNAARSRLIERHFAQNEDLNRRGVDDAETDEEL